MFYREHKRYYKKKQNSKLRQNCSYQSEVLNALRLQFNVYGAVITQKKLNVTKIKLKKKRFPKFENFSL